MSYRFYLKNTLLPVAPEKLSTKINGSNKTITLMNEGEVNLLKSPKLTTYEFDALLPNHKYPFSDYVNGYQSAVTYLNELENLLTSKAPFTFVVNRILPTGKIIFVTSQTVTLESYAILEDAQTLGTDVKVTIVLKAYRPFGTQRLKVTTSDDGQTVTTIVDDIRTPMGVPVETSHLLTNTDTLWSLAQTYYNDGSLYTLILDANRDVIENINQLPVGTMITIPAKR